jgi:hypothetical protein
MVNVIPLEDSAPHRLTAQPSLFVLRDVRK